MKHSRRSAPNTVPIECHFCGHVGQVDAVAICGRNAVTLRCTVCHCAREYRYGVPVKDTARRAVRRSRCHRRLVPRRAA